MNERLRTLQNAIHHLAREVRAHNPGDEEVYRLSLSLVDRLHSYLNAWDRHARPDEIARTFASLESAYRDLCLSVIVVDPMDLN